MPARMGAKPLSCQLASAVRRLTERYEIFRHLHAVKEMSSSAIQERFSNTLAPVRP